MASLQTSLGTYFLPNASRKGDKTAKTIDILQANTAGGAADADHTLTALAVRSDFAIDYVMMNVIEATSTANYTLLVGNQTVCSFKGLIHGHSQTSIIKELDFTMFGGLPVTGQTSTTATVQFVSSNAAATAGSKILTVHGHFI